MSTSYNYTLYNDDIIGNSKFKELRRMYRTPPPNSALYARPIASPASTHAQPITQQSTSNHKQPNGKNNLDIKSENQKPSSKQSANNSSQRQSVSMENQNLKNKTNKTHANAPNDRKINFTITAYNDDSAISKTPTPNVKHPHVKHVDAPTKQSKPIVSTAANGHDKANGTSTKSTFEPNKNSAKSPTANKKKSTGNSPSPVIKWVVFKDTNCALSNVTIAAYDQQQTYRNISVSKDHSIGSNESDVELRSTNKFSNGRPISLHINNNKPVENVIKSPGITIRTVDTLDDISSVELIPRLSIRQLKTILENEAVDPRDYVDIDQLRHKVTKLWLARQLIKEGRTDICQLCLRAKSDCLLLLCGHQTICMRCGEEVDECPVCRAFVVRKVHVYVN